MASDPSIITASISPEPVVVEAAGRKLHFPLLSASDWIKALADEDPITAIMPGLLTDESYDFVMDSMVEDRLDQKDLRRPAFDAITKASGFRWWEALSLVGLCEANAFVVGELTLRGIDPDAMPFGRWCAAVYALAIRGLDEKERQKWLARFNAPPAIAEAMDEAADSSSFEDMIRGFRGMPGARQG